MRHLFNKSSEEEHNFWMSYTDLLSGFLIVFIIICVVAYNKSNQTKKEYERITQYLRIENPDSLKNYITYLEYFKDSVNNTSLKNRIYEYKEIFTTTNEIKVEFDSLRESIKLTHCNPKCDLFDSGKDSIKSPLKEYLEERYVAIVNKTMEINNSAHNIELRIEGHADPNPIESPAKRGDNMSFIQNLDLSSRRANSVYKYILQGKSLDEEQRDFVKKNMISVGYSFSDRVQKNSIDIIYKEEDPSSRRIEFRIISK